MSHKYTNRFIELLADFDAEVFDPPSTIIKDKSGEPGNSLTIYDFDSADPTKSGTFYIFCNRVSAVLAGYRRQIGFHTNNELLTFIALRAMWNKIQNVQLENCVRPIWSTQLLLDPTIAAQVIGTMQARQLVREKYVPSFVKWRGLDWPGVRSIEREYVAHLIVACVHPKQTVRCLREFKQLAFAIGKRADGDCYPLSYMVKGDS